MSTSVDPVLAWEVELDRLELDILRVERLLRAMEPLEVEDWIRPEPTTPLPAELLERATAIHERQLRTMSDMARALQRSGRQRSFTQHVVESTRPSAAPVYVDVRT